MSWDVILLEEVERWYFALDADAMAAVTGAIDLLELGDQRWDARRWTRLPDRSSTA
jgi:hypothetical protein